MKINTLEIPDDVLDIGKEFQEDCHKFSDKMVEIKSNFTYQDSSDVWMFTKLAEFELRLRKLENK